MNLNTSGVGGFFSGELSDMPLLTNSGESIKYVSIYSVACPVLLPQILYWKMQELRGSSALSLSFLISALKARFESFLLGEAYIN